MHIFHVLFSDRPGGLEQAFVDYTEALAYNQHRITALIHPESPFKAEIQPFVHAIEYFAPKGFYDFFTSWRIRRLIKKLKPDVIIAHNGRAISVMKRAALGTAIPVIGVSHSYKTNRTKLADALIVLTEHMRAHFIAAGYDGNRLGVLRNMVRMPTTFSSHPRHSPLAIGAMGRFSEEKGFIPFLEALFILKTSGIEFKAHIAGEGAQLMQLTTLAENLGLVSDIEWLGWVHDKSAFYRSIDIFTLPSLSETFGLVALEAMTHGLPVVATDCPGPISFITHEKNGLIVKTGDSAALAQALIRYCKDPDFAQKMANAGQGHMQHFILPRVAEDLESLITQLLKQQ